MAVFFFFIIVVAAVIAVSVWKERRKHTHSLFAIAATRLGLQVSNDPSVLRWPWLYGEFDDIRVDVRPFSRNRNGTRTTWTGYRLSFPDPIAVSFAGEDDPRRRVMARLTNRFAECAISDDELFCAHSTLAEDSNRIVSDVEFLLDAARELIREHDKAMNALPDPSSETEKREDTPPPPLPGRREEPEAPVEPIRETVEAKASPFFEVDLEKAISNQVGSLSVPTPEKKVEPEPESEPATEEESSPPSESDAEPTDEKPAAKAPEPPSGSLGAAAKHLFDTGLNHFETGRAFESEYQGRSLEGTGVLRRVERFSHDRYFGRGPGFIAEVELRALENATGGLAHVTGLVQLPGAEETGLDLSQWRERLGEEVLVCGTLVHCDPFSGKIHLRDGLVDAPRAV